MVEVQDKFNVVHHTEVGGEAPLATDDIYSNDQNLGQEEPEHTQNRPSFSQRILTETLPLT